MQYDTEGNTIKRRARLVAQGLRLVFSVNFDETYVCSCDNDGYTTTWLVLSAQLGLNI